MGNLNAAAVGLSNVVEIAPGGSAGYLEWTGSAWTINTAMLPTGGTTSTFLRGDLTWQTPTATPGAGTVTLAMMANLAANSIIGNNSGSAATPAALTAAQVAALIGSSFTTITASTAVVTPVIQPASERHHGRRGQESWRHGSPYCGYDEQQSRHFERGVLADRASGADRQWQCRRGGYDGLHNSTSGIILGSNAGNAVLTCDTTNRICYPYRLVLPSY